MSARTQARETVFVRLAKMAEATTAVDGAEAAVRPLAQRLIATPGRRALLHGRWLGHALHPLLAMMPVGTWVSASLLDAVGGEEARGPARQLVGMGVVLAVPTAVTGAAEWAALEERPLRRVGLIHAAANATALLAYTGSWVARARGRHGLGRVLALAGGSAAGAGGFLGGHLTEARKVSSRHPAFEDGLSAVPDQAPPADL